MTTQKTAWSRAGEGRKGFGLLGAGAAQHLQARQLGWIFGAARRLCDAFITKGSTSNCRYILRFSCAWIQ